MDFRKTSPLALKIFNPSDPGRDVRFLAAHPSYLWLPALYQSDHRYELRPSI